jgi:hypothetical protein
VAVADIARALHLNQKRLYRTIAQLLATLRRGLEAEGISREEVHALFEGGALDEIELFDEHRAGAAGTPQPAERARTPWQRR